MAELTVVREHRITEHHRSCSCFITQGNLDEHVIPSTEEQRLGHVLTYSHITPNTCWYERKKRMLHSTTQAISTIYKDPT